MDPPPIIDVNLLKRAKDDVKLGVQTVVYRCVLVCVEQDWRSLLSPIECFTAVEALRKQIAPSHVQLTEQMTEQLLAWESGKKPEELETAAEQSEKRQASEIAEAAAKRQKLALAAAAAAPCAEVAKAEALSAAAPEPKAPSSEVPSAAGPVVSFKDKLKSRLRRQ